jgi:uncharacterized protein YkwD
MQIRHISITLVLGLLALLVLSIPGAPVVADPPDSGPPDPGPPDSGPLGVVSSITLEDQEDPAICYTGCGGPIVPAANAAYEQQVIDLVNAERAARGLPPFKLVSGLRAAARYHAADMGQDDYFEHDTYDRVGGRLQRVCDIWSRVRAYYDSPRAENIAAGYNTPQEVMEGWMGSGGHRDSILSTSYREIGVGYYRGGQWDHYWVQDFGQRSDVDPLVINREAAITNSVYVSLYLYGRDWDEVRLRNDEGAWSSWRPFANALDWTLSCGVGQHTVQAEMRSGGQTVTSSDTIVLAASPMLGGLPNEIHFIYSIPEGRLLPDSVRVSPRNVGNGDPFTWRATPVGAWFQVSSQRGGSADSFYITPTTYNTGVVGTYTGAVTVAAADPPGMAGSPQRIGLTLQVIDAPFETTYVPLVVGRSAP